MSLARKIFSNTAWQVIGKAVTAILGIVSIKLITNYLAPSIYGQYTTIYDYTALFAIVADFGLFTIAVREMAHDEKNSEKIIGNVLSIRTALALCALGVGTLAAFLIPAYSGTHIPPGVFIVSVATIITLVAGTMSSVLQFQLRMAWSAIGLIIGKIITVGYIALTVTRLFPENPEAGFPHLQYAWIFGGLVTLLVTYLATSRRLKIKFRFDFDFWKTVLIKALPYGTALMLGTIYFRMGTVTLSLYKMNEDTGRFGVPLRILEILQIVPHYFMNSVLPILTLTIKNDFARAHRIVRYCIDGLAAIALPLCVGGFMLAWPITSGISGAQFLTHRDAAGVLIAGSDMALQIMLVGMMATYVHVSLSYTLVAMQKQSQLLWIYGVAAVINIILNSILSPRFGFIGAAYTAAITELFMLVMLCARIRCYIKNIWDVRFLLKTALSAFLMGVVLFFVMPLFFSIIHTPILALLADIIVGAIVFGVGMLLTRALSPEMLSLFRKTKPEPIED